MVNRKPNIDTITVINEIILMISLVFPFIVENGFDEAIIEQSIATRDKTTIADIIVKFFSCFDIWGYIISFVILK